MNRISRPTRRKWYLSTARTASLPNRLDAQTLATAFSSHSWRRRCFLRHGVCRCRFARGAPRGWKAKNTGAGPNIRKNAKPICNRSWFSEESALNKKQAAGQVAPDDYARDKELLEFRYAQMAKESSIKYAYVWYQTAVDLFSPPESKWVRLSREKMPLAKERWKAELKAQKIPFEDYMLE